MNRFVLVAAGLSVSILAWAQDVGPPAPTATSNRAASLDERQAEPADAVFDTVELDAVPPPIQQPAPPKPDVKTVAEATTSQRETLGQLDGLRSEAAGGAVGKNRPGRPWTGRARRPGSVPVGNGSVGDKSLPWYRSTLVSLAVVLGVIAGLALLFKRLMPSHRQGRGGLVEVVGRTHLSAKQSLNLVRVGRRLVLVGATPEGMRALCEIDDPREVMEILARVPGSSASSSGQFEAVLSEAASDFEASDLEVGEVGQLPSAARLDEAKGRVRGLLDRLRTMQQQVDEPV